MRASRPVAVRVPSSGSTELIQPLERCPNCKTKSACRRGGRSGYICTGCGDERWGGIKYSGGPRVIGRSYSGGCRICWRCIRKNSVDGYLQLPYVTGHYGTITTVDHDLTFYCDECGVLIDGEC